MSHPYENAAIRIMDWLHHAERDLIGSTVTTFADDTGVVTGLVLDDHHGICFSFEPDPHQVFRDKPFEKPLAPVRWRPVSTIARKL